MAARLASIFGTPSPAGAEAADAVGAQAEPLPEPAVTGPVPVMAEPASIPVMAEPAPIPVMAEPALITPVPDAEPVPVTQVAASSAGVEAAMVAAAGPEPERPVVPEPEPLALVPVIPVGEAAGGGEPTVPSEQAPPEALAPEAMQPDVPVVAPPVVVPPIITAYEPAATQAPSPVPPSSPQRPTAQPVASMAALAPGHPTTYGAPAATRAGIWDVSTVDPGYAAAAAAAAESVRRHRKSGRWVRGGRSGHLARQSEDPRRRVGRDASAVLLVAAVAGLVLIGANTLQLPGFGATPTPAFVADVQGTASATPRPTPSPVEETVSPYPTATVPQTSNPPATTPTAGSTPPVTGGGSTPVPPTPRPPTRPTATPLPPLTAIFTCDPWTTPANAPVTCSSQNVVAGASYEWLVGPDPSSLTVVGHGSTLIYVFTSDYADNLGFIRLVVTRGKETATKDGAVTVQ